MKKCLTYMSRFWGPAKIWLVLWIIFIAVFNKNAFILIALIYTANAMALSIYGADLTADMYFVYGRGDGRLTLSLPMSRKTIYDTRMYMAGGIYLISLILSVFPFIKFGLFLEYFISAGTLLFGHIICGFCIRKPHLHGIAGLPAFMLLIVQLVCDLVESIQYQIHQIEKNRTVISFTMVLYIIMFAIDVYVWLRERRIFIYGNPKGNVIRKEKIRKIRKNEKYYGTEKKKIIMGTVIALVIFGGPISASLSKDFMLRAAVFPVSPQSALTMEYEYYKDLPDSDNGKLYIITKNIPVEKETQGELYTWVVYNYGPFYFAKYYGEG